MQNFRTAKPHTEGSCRLCADDGPGHYLCMHSGCDEIAESQHRRHATEQEYAQIPEVLVPADGVAHVAVFTCGDHELDPTCGPEHHQVGPMEQADPLGVECPKCGAAPGWTCTKADGAPRSGSHEVRGPAPTLEQLMGGRCDHAHRADCGGLGSCECSVSDAVPERKPRPEDGQR